MKAKLNPQGTARVNYPGFQEILDFISTGVESSTSVSVNGDTDLEYIIEVFNPSATVYQILRLNSDSGSNYGHQYLRNVSGTVSCARAVDTALISGGNYTIDRIQLIAPSGLIKTAYSTYMTYSSGTNIANVFSFGNVWNSTANVTSLNFSASSGNFVSGTRITVYARRS